MTHAYDEMYTQGAMQRMGDMLEFAALDLHMDPDAFFKLFLDSPYARAFEIGDVSIIAGRSGPELAGMVLFQTDHTEVSLHPTWREDRSDIYWAGWILAYFQWYSNRSFSDIWKYITVRKLQKMYPTLHEADVMKSVETMERMMIQKKRTKIAELRTMRGWSQAQLAEMAGMTVSQLQRLEYGERKTDHLSLKTAIALSDALGIDVRELAE